LLIVTLTQLFINNRPYKVWLTTPIIFGCVAIFLIIMPFARVPLQSLAAVGFILAGVPFWYIRVKYKETFSMKGNQ
jgi:hypothetical protein